MLSVNQELQGGRYRILNQFGQGDTGVSYQAFDNVLQTKVIIKETFADQPNIYKNSIARQMENLTSIKHESFTQVHGYFSEVDRQYLVTESTESESLKELLDKYQKPFPLFDVLLWTEQSLNALNYLHSKMPPIIHCGINPSNLILTNHKRIKLLTSTIIKDLGAKENDKKQFNDLKLPYLSLELLWETLDPASQKVILNSYDVESAEILESPVDERSSVYALGATIYHLVTGKTPINALERSIEILDGKDDPLISPNQLNSQVPRNFSDFLVKALELKRENRFLSVSVMRTTLQPMLDLMRKLQTDRQKEVAPIEAKSEDQAIREAALREVELARQALRKKREEEALAQAQAEQQALQLQAEKEAEKEAEEARKQIAESVSEIPAVAVNNEIIAKSEPVEVESQITSQLVATALPTVEEPIAEVVAFERETELFSSEPIEGKKPFWLIPVLAGVLVLGAGGFFGMKFLNSNNAENSTPKVAEQNDVPKTEANPAATTQLASPTASPEPTNPELPKTAESATIPTTEPKPVAKKPTAPNQTVEKKPSTTDKTPAPKKKEVSVDDIINDN